MLRKYLYTYYTYIYVWIYSHIIIYLVCVVRGIQSVLCVGFHLCYVQSLVCAMWGSLSVIAVAFSVSGSPLKRIAASPLILCQPLPQGHTDAATPKDENATILSARLRALILLADSVRLSYSSK